MTALFGEADVLLAAIMRKAFANLALDPLNRWMDG